ncbi:SMI1/KNR4 family protein [Chryseobacterium takakiae]|jgi:hypothetical protein|uniref:SMI1 / KNR4 family (SUKH-1) n=1 Tax=Chryseobacterium takakiae TaxID=1302685 RepID=A0A1M5C0V0_9FLAO|nr:SMI1/KNR4 family protein [Chryseobacterium takakiae]SHF48290.1 SMI1 / KNR4 family (SUKH-1) [Chryseobacterium takakiae]
MEDKEQNQLILLKKHFVNEGVNNFTTVDDLKIHEFQNNNAVLIPSDLKQYFMLINGSDDIPLDNLFEFYGIDRVNRIVNEFKDWKGVPDYSKLDFQKFENVFIFGNYEFNFYSFGIELSNTSSSTNRIFIFCGEEYKVIANSFDDFIDLYLNNPEEIFM